MTFLRDNGDDEKSLLKILNITCYNALKHFHRREERLGQLKTLNDFPKGQW